MRNLKQVSICSFLFIGFALIAACSTARQANNFQAAGHVKNQNVNLTKRVSLSPTWIQVIQGPDRLRVILYSDVCFQPNGRLMAECAAQLASAMKIIKQYGNGCIQIVGYTDDIYDPQMSDAISLRQANSVLAFLWSNGIESQRLRAVGYGNHDPIASNRNVKANAYNRRVEITLVK